MITDLRTSINSILYQRVTSPLFGTFIVSWIVLNWKILYATFIIDSDKIEQTKIDYIVSNFNDVGNLIWYPLISTFLLITIIPFVSNGAYWVSLKFEQWRIDNKHKIERKKLLTLEQSIQLREQILDYEKKFETLLNEKDEEIKQLKLLIEKSSKDENTNTGQIKLDSNEDKIEKRIIEIFNKVNNNSSLKKAVFTINEYIQGGYSKLSQDDNITPKILAFFESNDLIENQGQGMYKWTEKGKRLNQLIVDLEFNNTMPTNA